MKISSPITLPQAEAADAKRERQEKTLREGARQYEAQFLNQMVKAMRSTVNREGGLLKPNFAEQIFMEQLDQQTVEGWTHRGGVGLADLIYNQVHERFFPQSHTPLPKPRGPLPIEGEVKEGQPRFKMQAPETAPAAAGPSAQKSPMTYWFELDKKFPYSGTVPVRSPWAGQITAIEGTPDGTQRLSIRHGVGLTSLMQFEGTAQGLEIGKEIEAGQKLGELSFNKPQLAWKVLPSWS